MSITTNANTVGHEPTHMGARLGAARIAAGLSLKDAAEKLCIQYSYLDAIERLDKEVLPGLGYALGYVRTYARLLQFNEHEAIAQFKADMTASHDLEIVGESRFVPKRKIRLPRGSFAIGTVLACALVVVTWYGMKTDARSAAPALVTVAPTENWAFEPVQPGQGDTAMIALKAVGPSWVEVKDAAGRVLISRIMLPGEIFETSRENLPVLSLRDAGAIELYLGGKRLGPVGQHGYLAKNIPLAEVALQ